MIPSQSTGSGRRLPVMRVFAMLVLTAGAVSGDQAVLENWLKRQAEIRTIDTTFTQERKLPSLKEPVTTRGRLSFEKPGRVRWQLGDPPVTVAFSDGTTMTLLDFEKRTARSVTADSPQAARFSVLAGKGFQTAEDFHKAFEISAHRVDGGIHQFTLRPKDRRLRADVPWIFLSIDPRGNELRAMELELKDRSRIRTVFDKPAINTKLPAALFTPDLAGFEVK